MIGLEKAHARPGEQVPFLWIVQGRELGKINRSYTYRCGDFFYPAPIHWCCPVCGEVWAHLIPLTVPSVAHRFLTRPCPQCTDTPTLRNPWDDPNPYASFSEEALCWEILHINPEKEIL